MNAYRSPRMILRRVRSLWNKRIRTLAEDAVDELESPALYQLMINEFDLGLRSLKLVPTDAEAWDQVERIADIADLRFSKTTQAMMVASLRGEEPTPKVINRILKQELWK